MTNTTIINNVSIGTSTNVGSPFNPVKTTLQTATTAIKVNFRVTFGGAGGSTGSKVRFWQACSQVSYSTAVLGALALQPGAIYTDIPLQNQGSVDVERPSDIIVTASGYHYCWITVPTLDVAAGAYAYLQELP